MLRRKVDLARGWMLARQQFSALMSERNALKTERPSASVTRSSPHCATFSVLFVRVRSPRPR
jgi:hypothetical protein